MGSRVPTWCGNWGAFGIMKVLNDLNLEKLKGTIIGLPIANIVAYYGASRNTPIDQENLNRLFLGRQTTFSYRLAFTLFSNIMEIADVVIDLHSGGDRWIVPFYSLVCDVNNQAAEKALDLAKRLGTRFIWKSSDDWLKGVLFMEITKRGKPAIIVKCGGGTIDETQVNIFYSVLYNSLRHLKMVEGNAPSFQSYQIVTNCHLMYANKDGFFVPTVKAGEIIQPGGIVGHVYDLYGKVREKIRGPKVSSFIASIHQDYRAIYSGDFVAECGELGNEIT